MKATARDFTRKFPVYRRAAKAGQTVQVRDRDGVTYVFARDAKEAPSLSDVAGHLLGSVNSGVRKKSLAGYADACLVRLSELHRSHVVVTTDAKDFHVYRRFRREPLPLLTP